MHINYAKAIELANEVVAKKGEDFIYRNPTGETGGGCLYTHPDGPGCLWGHVVRKLVPDWVSTELEGLDIHSVVKDLGWSATNKALNFMREVQSLQDIGTPWGVAVLEAQEACEPAGEDAYDENEEYSW